MSSSDTPEHGQGRVSRRTLLQGMLGMAASAAVAACQGSPAPTPAPTAAPAAPTRPAAATAGSPPAATAAPSPRAYSPALSKHVPFKVTWNAVSGAMSGIWMAHETGAWKELGLDSEVTHVPSSSRVVAAMESGEVDGGPVDWVVAFQSVAAGGTIRELAAMTNRQIFSVFSKPEITSPQQLKGKTWGITRVGSSTHTASLVALDMWGMSPSDVTFLQLQEVPAILAALVAGQVDAGTVSPPTSITARSQGFKELVNLATDGPEYPSIAIGTTEARIAKGPDEMRAFVAGYAMGVQRFRTNKAKSLEVLSKYLQSDDQDLLQNTWTEFSKYLAFPPALPLQAAERVQKDVASTDPRVANVTVAQIVDTRFYDELDRNGFFAQLK